MINIIIGMAILIANVLNLICIAVDWHRETNIRIKNQFGWMLAVNTAMTVVMVAALYAVMSTTPLASM